MKKIISILILSILFIGCAQTQPRIASTKSGMPEISISSTNKSIVKSHIIDEIFAAGKGYIIISETDSRIVFSRVPQGFSADLAQVLIVGASGERPRVEVTFTISSRPESITVYAQLAQVYKHAYGKVTRVDGTNNKYKNFNDLYLFLEKVKSKVIH